MGTIILQILTFIGFAIAGGILTIVSIFIILTISGLIIYGLMQLSVMIWYNLTK